VKERREGGRKGRKNQESAKSRTVTWEGITNSNSF
jgi:hypothetical protein